MRVASKLICTAMSLVAMAGRAQAAPNPAYDVISIKPNKTLSHSIHVSIDNGIYIASNVNIRMLIEYAYGLKVDAQLSGLSGWSESSSFDIQAKMDPDEVLAMNKLSQAERKEEQCAMMRSLLAERFHLAIHHEMKVLSTFSLVVAKSGVKFKEAADEEPRSTHIDNQKMTAKSISMDSFADTLSRQVKRQVINKTELPGKYDFTLVWSPEDAPAESKATTGVDSAPSLFTAVQEQLGLKLESAKDPVDTIVVEHVEQPSEN